MSSQLSLLLLANTFESAAELGLHNPGCQTLRKKKTTTKKQTHFRSLMFSGIFLDAFCGILIKDVVKLHQTENHG